MRLRPAAPALAAISSRARLRRTNPLSARNDARRGIAHLESVFSGASSAGTASVVSADSVVSVAAAGVAFFAFYALIPGRLSHQSRVHPVISMRAIRPSVTVMSMTASS